MSFKVTRVTSEPRTVSDKDQNKHLITGEVVDTMRRTTATNKDVLVLRVCTRGNRSRSYHRVILWGGLARKHEDVKKGSVVHVEGPVKGRSYTDKQGTRQNITETIANEIEILSEPTDSKKSVPASDDFNEPLPLEEEAVDTTYADEGDF